MTATRGAPAAEQYGMGTPATPDIDALIAEARDTLRQGANRLDVLDDAVAATLVAIRVLSTVVDRLEGEVAELRSDLASTRKIAKQARRKAAKG